MSFDLVSWLREIGMESYQQRLQELGFDRVERILAMGDDDFDDVGFNRRDGNRFDQQRQALSAASSRQAGAAGPGPALAGLPIYLAIPWAEYLSESHPRIRLHLLCDSVELMVRWAVVVSLSEIRAAHREGLPPRLKEAVAGWIERPTFGQWLGGLRELRRHLPPSPRVAAALLDWAERPLDGAEARLEDLVDNRGDASRSLLRLRNDLSHGGGLSRSAAQARLLVHEPLLLDLMNGLATAMGGLQLVAVDGDSTLLLCGTRPSPIARPAALAGQRARTWLVGDTALELTPLLRYELVHYPRSDQTGDPAPQCYFRGNQVSQTYIPLGDDTMASDVADPEFARLFLAPRKPAIEGVPAYTWHSFLDEAPAISEGMIGRLDALASIKSWRKALDAADPRAARIGWFHGLPGMGKSTLMARLAADLRHGGNVYYHRFKEGDRRNNRDDFLRCLAQALLAWPALRAAGEPQGAGTVEERARDLLGRIGRIEFAPSHAGDKPPFFTIIADGLDEIASHDPGFPALLKTLAMPGTVWVLSSRPGLESHFEAMRIPGLERLEPMSTAEVRAMFLQALQGGKERGLLRRDDDPDPSLPPRNRYVESVLARAEGCPLYVHYVIEDILAGQLPLREDRLPAGLDAYYVEMLDRVGLSAAKERLHHVVALLACSYEPLDGDALTRLTYVEGLDYAREADLTRQALRAGATLLRASTTFDANAGSMLYHTSFRDFLGAEGNRLAPLVAKARLWLADRAGGWRALAPHSLAGYLARNGVTHLLDLGRLPQAIELLHDLKQGLPEGVRLPVGHLAITTRTIAGALDDWLERWTDEEATPAEREVLAATARAIQPAILAEVFNDTYETAIYAAALRILIEFHPEDWWSDRDGIRSRFLVPEDIVARHAVGEALADLFLRCGGAQRDRVMERIGALSASDALDEREAAGYAFAEIFQADPSLIPAHAGVIERMARVCGATERMILGEMLVYFSLHDAQAQAADKVHFERLIDAGQAGFWNPVWDYNLIDLVDFHALAGTEPPVRGRVTRQAVELARQERASAAALRRRLADDPWLHRDDSAALRVLLQEFEGLKTGDPRIHRAMPLLERALEQRRDLVKDFARLLFSHPLWTIAEAGSSLLAELLLARPAQLSLLREMLAEEDQPWRVRYGVVDASFNLRELDDGALFLESFVRSINHPNARVRGICLDNFLALLRLGSSQRRQGLLEEYDSQLRTALAAARDVWELEYLHLLFGFLDRQGFEVPAWLARGGTLSRYLGAPGDAPFYRLDRADFLTRIDTIRGRELGSTGQAVEKPAWDRIGRQSE